MFAVVLTFQGENEQDLQDGIAQVQEETVPVLADSPGMQGLFLVDRANGRRVTILLCESQEKYDAAIERVAEARLKQPERRRLLPESWTTFEIYDSVGLGL